MKSERGQMTDGIRDFYVKKLERIASDSDASSKAKMVAILSLLTIKSLEGAYKLSK